MAAGGRAVFEVAPQGVAGESPAEASIRELDWMTKLAAEIERPVSFAMIQTPGAPDLWRDQLERARQGGRERHRGLRADRGTAVRDVVRLPGLPRVHPPADIPRAEGGTAIARNWRDAWPIRRCARRSWPTRSSARPDGAVRRDVRADPAQRRQASTQSAIRPTTSRRPIRRSPSSQSDAARIRWPRCTT